MIPNCYAVTTQVKSPAATIHYCTVANGPSSPAEADVVLVIYFTSFFLAIPGFRCLRSAWMEWTIPQKPVLCRHSQHSFTSFTEDTERCVATLAILLALLAPDHQLMILVCSTRSGHCSSHCCLLLQTPIRSRIPKQIWICPSHYGNADTLDLATVQTRWCPERTPEHIRCCPGKSLSQHRRSFQTVSYILTFPCEEGGGGGGGISCVDAPAFSDALIRRFSPNMFPSISLMLQAYVPPTSQ